MIIRKASRKDINEIVGLWVLFRKELESKIVWINKKQEAYLAIMKKAKSIFRCYLTKCINSSKSIVFVAEEEGKLIGYSLIKIKENIPLFKIRRLGYFGDLFVLKEYRGRGISSRFKEEAIKWFKKKGIKHLSISISPENKKARSIYQKWGFFNHRIEMRTRI